MTTASKTTLVIVGLIVAAAVVAVILFGNAAAAAHEQQQRDRGLQLDLCVNHVMAQLIPEYPDRSIAELRKAALIGCAS